MALLATEGFGWIGDGLTVGTAKQVQSLMSPKWVVDSTSAALTAGRHPTGTNYSVSLQGATGFYKAFPAKTTVFVGHAFYAGSLASQTTFLRLHTNTTASSSAYIGVRVETTGAITIVSNIGTSLLATAAGVVAASTWCFIEVGLTTLNNASTALEIRVNGVSRATGTADTTFLGGGVQSMKFVGNGVTMPQLQDIYICDSSGSECNTFLGDVRIECLRPNADGNYSQWSLQQLNRLTPNQSGAETDATFMQSNLSNCSVTRVTSSGTLSAPATGTGFYKITAGTAAAFSAETATGTSGIPVVAGKPYIIAYHEAKTSAGSSVTLATCTARWWDAAGSLLSTTSVRASGTPGSSWLQRSSLASTFPAPANAATVSLVFAGTASAPSDALAIDSILVTEDAFDANDFRSFDTSGQDADHYDAVRDPQQNNNSYVYSDTVNQRDSWGLDNLVSTSGVVKGVMVHMAVNKTVGGTRSIKPFFRIGGTNYDLTAEVLDSDTAYAATSKDQAVHLSPATSSAWTISELNGAELGVVISA